MSIKNEAATGAAITEKQRKDNQISAIKELKDLYLEENRKKFPSIPEQCRVTPQYKPKTANGLTRMCIDLLRLSGWQAERISNTGRLIDNSKVAVDCIGRARKIGSTQWIKGTGTNGTADVSATIAGRSVKIEVKMKDRQSEAQRKYQADVERSGGVYIIVRDFGSFLHWYKHFIADVNGGE